MANVDLTEVATATPADADHVVGVTVAGALRRFLVSTWARATRTVNGHPLTADVVVTSADVGAPAGSGTSTGTNTGDQDLSGYVPTTRTVNGHALSADVVVTAADLSLGNVDNTSDANKPVSTATATALAGKVPTTRTVNGHALSADVVVTAADVGAVPTTRTVNGQALSANITLTAANVGAPAGSGTSTGSNTGDQNLGAAISYTAGPGIPYRIVGANIAAGIRNFNITASSATAVPGDPGNDDFVVMMGHNQTNGGGRENAADGTIHISFEQSWYQGGVRAFEWHLQSMDTSGIAHRPITGFFPKDGGLGSGMGLQVDRLFFGDYDELERVVFDFRSGQDSITFPNGSVRIIWPTNNVVVASQRNAANSAFLSLPYIGSDNALTSTLPFRFAGNTPTTGGDPNTYAVFRANTGVNGGRVFQADANFQLTGSLDIGYLQAYTTSETRLTLINSKTAGGSAVVDILVADASSGDATTRFGVAGVAAWTVGLDNSDADKFKIGTAALGGADKLTLTTNGDLSLSGSVKTASYTVATLPSASALGQGAYVYVSDAAVAPCLAFSQGALWKRCDNAATTVI